MSAGDEIAPLFTPAPVPAPRPAAVIPDVRPDPTARTVFFVYQTAEAAYHESPYEALGEGVVAVVWWAWVLSDAKREGIETRWVAKFGRGEALAYYWHEYPANSGTSI